MVLSRQRQSRWNSARCDAGWDGSIQIMHEQNNLLVEPKRTPSNSPVDEEHRQGSAAVSDILKEGHLHQF
jgi:hypothetical protein